MSRLLPLFRPGGAPTGVGLRRRPVVAGDPPAAVALAWPLEADPATWAAGETYVSRHYAHRSATLSATATGATSVQFWLDGAGSGTLLGTAADSGGGAFALDWDCSGAADGSHAVTARAVSGGGTLDSTSQPVMVWNGPESPPDLSGVTPEAGPIYLAATGPQAANGSALDASGLLAFDGGTKTYTLLRDVAFPGVGFVLRGDGVTLDLGGFAVGWNGDGVAGQAMGTSAAAAVCGVFLSKNFATLQGQYLGIAETTNATSCAIRNGTLVQLTPGVDGQSAIAGYDPAGLVVDGVTAFASGKDSSCVRFAGSEVDATQYRGTVRNCRFLAFTDAVSNRQAGPACIYGANKAWLVEDSVILGGNSGVVAGSNTTVRRCVISQLDCETNGYGIWSYKKTGIAGADNAIIPINGRGINVSGDDGYNHTHACSGHSYSGNIVLVCEHPNREYGSNLNPSGVRVRWEQDTITVSGNTCLAVAGPSCNGHARVGGIGFNDTIGTDDGTDADYCSGHVVTGNRFDAISLGTPAWGACFNGHLAGVGMAFGPDNACRSNLYPFGISGPEGDGDLAGTTAAGNTIAFADGATIVADFLADLDALLLANGQSDDPWAAWARDLIAAELGGDPAAAAPSASRATVYANHGINPPGTRLYSHDQYARLLSTSFAGGAKLDSDADVKIGQPSTLYAYRAVVEYDASGDGTYGDAGDRRWARQSDTTGPMAMTTL